MKSAPKSTYSLLSPLERRTLTIRRGKAPKQTTRCRAGDAGARYGSCG